MTVSILDKMSHNDEASRKIAFEYLRTASLADLVELSHDFANIGICFTIGIYPQEGSHETSSPGEPLDISPH